MDENFRQKLSKDSFMKLEAALAEKRLLDQAQRSGI